MFAQIRYFSAGKAGLDFFPRGLYSGTPRRKKSRPTLPEGKELFGQTVLQQTNKQNIRYIYKKHTMPHTTQKPNTKTAVLLEYSELELLRRTDANPALHELLAQAVPLPKTAEQPQHYALNLTEEQSDNLADCLTGILLHQGCDPQGEVNALGFFVESLLDRLP